MSSYKEVACSFCKKKLYKETGRYNENLKLGHNFYCSKLCSYKYKKTGRELICENSLCKKKFYRPLNDILTHNYCSRSCSATVNNKKFPKWPEKKCQNKLCGKMFRREGSLYCSSMCGYTSWKRSHNFKYTPQQITDFIRKFFSENDRVPAKRELGTICDMAIRLFGSWNKAIETAGLKPNRSHDHRMYKRTKTKATDGHLCDSVSEAIIDNWLTENQIPHKRNAHYPSSKHLADWSIKDNVFIEYFGLAKDSPRYDRSIRVKEKLCGKYNIKLIAIYPKDLYPKVRLQDKLADTFHSQYLRNTSSGVW